jgi:hypothetical protein
MVNKKNYTIAKIHPESWVADCRTAEVGGRDERQRHDRELIIAGSTPGVRLVPPTGLNWAV